jgi:hypothetical protein
MNKLLLALGMFGAGGAALLTARQATSRTWQEEQTTRADWAAQTQLLAAAQADAAGLRERVRELTAALARPLPAGEDALWSVLQTNALAHLSPELRGHLLEELGFNWQTAPGFVVVTKEALREFQLQAIQQDKLPDPVAAALAVTAGERERVDAAFAQVRSEFNDWASAHTDRAEPEGDAVAEYTLQRDPAMGLSFTNTLAAALAGAVGRERAELLLPSAGFWMIVDVGIGKAPMTMIVKHAGSGPRLEWTSIVRQEGSGGPYELSSRRFPAAFRPVFPNGWADVAAREGFDLPPEDGASGPAERKPIYNVF